MKLELMTKVRTTEIQYILYSITVTSPNSPCPSFSSTRSCSLGKWHNGVSSSSSSSSVAVVSASGLMGAPYVEDILVPWTLVNCGTVKGGGDKGGGGGGGCGAA
jgi:hypothetical protein